MNRVTSQRVLLLLLPLLAALILSRGQAVVSASADTAPEHVNAASLYVPGELIVKLTPEAARTLKQTGAVAGLAGLNQTYQVAAMTPLFPNATEQLAKAYQIQNIYVLQVPESVDIWQMAAAYAAHPAVVYAEPDQRVWFADLPLADQFATDQVQGTADPLYAQQWSLNNTGQTGGSYDADVDMEEVYTYLASHPPVYNPTVAMLDTGVDLNHEDLRNKVLPGYDFVSDDFDPSDTDGHGTGTASIVGAETNNNVGMAGVCPNCRILPMRVGTWVVHFGSREVAEGIYYASNPAYGNADVISMSLGGTCSDLWTDAVNYAYDQNVIMVSAAGNLTGPIVVYPAKYERVLAISATDKYDDFAWWSAFGPEIDVSAPGQAVLVADRYDNYGTMTGTSSATPHVAGTAALLLGQNPSLTNAQMRQIIRASADPKGFPGYDWFYGYGRLNAYTAILQAQNPPGSSYDPPAETNCEVIPIFANLPGPTANMTLGEMATLLKNANAVTAVAPLLHQHRGQLAALIVANSDLTQQLTSLVETAVPYVQAWQKGDETVLVSADFVHDAESFVMALADVANPDLSQALQTAWAKLDLAAMVGKPASQAIGN